MSLEISIENPATWYCCMRVSMRADGMTCHSRHTPVVRVGPGGIA